MRKRPLLHKIGHVLLTGTLIIQLFPSQVFYAITPNTNPQAQQSLSPTNSENPASESLNKEELPGSPLVNDDTAPTVSSSDQDSTVVESLPINPPPSENRLNDSLPLEIPSLTDTQDPTSVPTVGDTFSYENLPYKVLSLPNAQQFGTLQLGTGTSLDLAPTTHLTLPTHITLNDQRYTVTHIADNTFQQLKTETITLPANLISIGYQSFYASQLTHLTLPNSVSEIGARAFMAMTNLEELTLSHSLERIPANFLANSRKLTTIIIPEGVKTIEPEAFRSMASLQTVNLPASLEVIDEHAFSQNRQLTHVLLADNSRLKLIGNHAFYQSQALAKIALPSTIEAIGISAFQDAQALSEVGDLSLSNLQILGVKAFYNTKLTSLSLPMSLTSIGTDALNNIPTLTALTISQDNPQFSTQDGVLYTKDFSRLMLYPLAKENLDYTAPDSLKVIDSWVFANQQHLVNILLPTGLTTIGHNAFQGAAKIRTLTIPNSVTTIGQGAFVQMAHLETLILPEELTKIERFTIFRNPELKELVLPAKVSRIESSGIALNNQLTSLKIEGPDVTFSRNTLGSSVPDTLKITVVNQTVKERLILLGISETQIKVEEASVQRLGKVTIHYLGPEQQPLVEPTSIEGTIGHDYQTEALEITGYHTLALPENAQGQFQLAEQAVTYYYHATPQLTVGTTFNESNITYQILSLPTATSPGTLQIGDGSRLLLPATQLLELPENVHYQNQPFKVTQIGDNAFRSLQASKISLPESLVAIGQNAFRYSQLTEVLLPHSVKQIGKGAFMQTDSLEKLILPNSLKVIPQDFLHQAASLKRIDLPEGIEIIEANAFRSMESLRTVNFASTIKVIGDSAFHLNSSLVTLNLPPTSQLKTIERRAFYFSNNFKQLLLPNTIETIGPQAFSFSEKLENLGDLSQSQLKSLGDLALYKTKLTNVTLPETLTEIGKDAFLSMTELKSIVVSATNLHFTSQDGVLYDKGLTRLINYPIAKDSSNYIAPRTLATIDNYAFEQNKHLTTIDLPTGLTQIGSFAFRHAAKITTLAIPNSVTEIGRLAIADMPNLQHFSLPDQLVKISDHMIYNNPQLKELTLPKELTEILTNGISRNHQLEKLNILAEDVTFKRNALGAPNENESLVITVVNQEIKERVIALGFPEDRVIIERANVPALTVGAIFELAGITYKILSLATAENAGTVQIGDGTPISLSPEETMILPQTVDYQQMTFTITEIAPKAFQGLKVQHLTLPTELLAIGQEAFSHTDLITLTLPPLVNELGTGAFSHNKDLVSLNLTSSVKEIPQQLAFNSPALTELVLPESVETIGKQAFSALTSLTTVTLPASLTLLGEEAFARNPSLVQVNIPETSQLATIGPRAFHFNQGLESINLPNSLQVIGNHAFHGASQLKDIGDLSNAQLNYLGDSAFYGSSLVSIALPKSLLEIGPNVFNQVLTLEQVTIDDDNQHFYSDQGVLYNKNQTRLLVYPIAKSTTTYQLPERITSIDDYTFEHNRYLTTLILPDELTSIGDFAFRYAQQLQQLVLPNSVTSIGREALADMAKLTTLALPESLEVLGEYVIYNNPNLKELILPANLVQVEKRGVSNNTQLSKVTILAEEIDLYKTSFDTPQQASNLQFYVINETVKGQLLALGFKPEQIKLLPEDSPTIGKFFQQAGITYKILSLPTATNAGTVQVGDGLDNATHNLSHVSLPTTLDYQDETYLVTTIGERAFYQNDSLAELILSDGLKNIDAFGIFGNAQLTQLTLPDSVTVINEFGLANNEQLQQLNLNSTSQLKELHFSALAGNDLQALVLPVSLEQLGQAVFAFNHNLTAVQFASEGILKELPRRAFFRTDLRSITLPKSLTTIGEEAFYFNQQLTTINLEAITEFGDRAFAYTGLIELTLADTLDYLGNGVFYENKHLQHIHFGQNLQTLGLLSVFDPEDELHGVFENNQSLTSLTIPASVTVIGKNTFRNSSALKEIHLEMLELTRLGANAFYEIKPTALFYVKSQQVKDRLLEEDILEEQIILLKDDTVEPVTTGQVIVHHLTQTDIPLREPLTLTGNIGQEYVTEPLFIENYRLVGQTDNVTGLFDSQINSVTYYYEQLAEPLPSESRSVLVQYLTASNEELAPAIELTGQLGQPYHTTPLTIPGYILEKEPDNAHGFFALTLTNVIYRYQAESVAPLVQGKVIVNYLDQLGNQLRAPVHLVGQLGESYLTEPLVFKDYLLVGKPDYTQGLFTEEVITVSYLYQKATSLESLGHILITYQTIEGTLLLPSETLTAAHGQPYQTQDKTFAGYSLIALPSNAQGHFSANPIAVVYLYQKTPLPEYSPKPVKHKVMFHSKPHTSKKQAKDLPKTGETLTTGGQFVFWLWLVKFVILRYLKKDDFLV